MKVWECLPVLGVVIITLLATACEDLGQLPGETPTPTPQAEETPTEAPTGPYIDNLYPASGAPGIPMSIRGQNFDEIFGMRWVNFGGKHADEVLSWSENEIVVKVPPLSCVPARAETVNVAVEGPGYSSNSKPFTYLGPRVESISPSFAEPGKDVIIKGKDFGVKGASDCYWVKFGNSLAKIKPQQWDNNKIVVVAPSDYGTGVGDAELVHRLFVLAKAGWDESVEEAIDEIADTLLDIFGIDLLTIELRESDPWWIALTKIMTAIGLPGVKVHPEGNMDVAVTVRTPAGEGEAVLFTYDLPEPEIKVKATPTITDRQKQQEILNMVNNHRGSISAELILAIIRQEGGEGAFHINGWSYNSFYRQGDEPWAQPTNGDGVMQVTAASGYHERSGPYTHDQDGYGHVINDGCDYLLEHYNTHGSYVQSTLHYNTGPNSLYIYLGKNWGDRNYLSHIAEHLNSFVINTYDLQNQNLVEALNQGQDILNDYLYNKGIATGQSVDYYRPYQTQLDSDLHNIERPVNHAPTAYIDSISPNPANQGQAAFFNGYGTDPDAGDSITAYNWRSSIDGQLSTSSSFAKSNLSTGTHTIYFKARDSHNTWSTEVTRTLTINRPQPPSPPTPTSPGSTSSLGQTIDTLTPTFQWSGVSGADRYGLYISEYPYGSTNIVYENENISGSSTSFSLPGGVLQNGNKYRWNMRAYNSTGWSDFSGRLYFKVNTETSLPKLVDVGISSETESWPPRTFLQAKPGDRINAWYDVGYSGPRITVRLRTTIVDPSGGEIANPLGDTSLVIMEDTPEHTGWVGVTFEISAEAVLGTYDVRFSVWSKDGAQEYDAAPKIGWLRLALEEEAEAITAPSTPIGLSSGEVNQSLSYSTGGAGSNLGHSLEYRFDWGDGSYSNWSSSTTASHSWSSQGTYAVRAQARCATHTSVVSDWSSGLSVNIKPLSSASARIDSYSPSSPVDVIVGNSTTISVTFTNTGNTAWSFIAGATVWDANGNQVANYSKTLSVPLQPQQQTTVSWTHPVNQAGDYWLQFGIWKATPFTAENLLDKEPSPSQKLIIGHEPSTIDASINSYSPSSTTDVTVGDSVTISVTFANTGNTPWKFVAGASVWDANGNIVADYETTLSTDLQPSQQKTVSWTHPVNQPGDYWLQFGVWKDHSNLLDKAPSPSQKLIVGHELAKFSAGDRVRTTANVNVRTGPGTGYPEITDLDYPGYAPAGSTGVVVSGPVSADGYVWWEIQYDAGYSGWSAENWLEKA